MTEFMITLRKPDGSDGVGPPRYLTFDGGGADTDLASSTWLAKLIAQFPEKASDRSGVNTREGDILFLVHGFNVDHGSAKAFHLKCVAGLNAAGWFGQVVSFDWPSDGLVFAYIPDRFNARAAASALVMSGISLLEAAQQQDCEINVHVLSHSMGGFVVQQAFTWAYQDVPPDWKVGQLLFAAADVDHSVFSAGTVSANAFQRHAGRLTAYCNRYDKALVASNAKRAELAPRMGRVGLPDDAPPMMCEVDASDLFAKTYPGLIQQLSPETTHCFYFDRPEFWRDVVLTLAGGIDRNVFPTRDQIDGKPNRFELKPDGIDTPTYQAALAHAATNSSHQPGAAPG